MNTIHLFLKMIVGISVFHTLLFSQEEWRVGYRDSIEVEFNKITGSKQSNELDDIIESLENIAANNNENQEVHYYLGCAYDLRLRTTGRYSSDPSSVLTKKISREFQKVLSIHPTYSGKIYKHAPFIILTNLWGDLALKYIQQGKKESAVAALKEGKIAGGFSSGLLEYGRNILRSCDKDGIVFTNIDNETYLIFYLQMIERFRTDVTTVDLSLLNVPSYIIKLKKEGISSHNLIRFSLPDSDIVHIGPMRWDTKEMVLKDPVKFTFPSTLKLGTMSAIRAQDFLLYDIIRTNEWKRPLYFSVAVTDDQVIGLKHFLRFEGFVNRIVPKLLKTEIEQIHETKIRELIGIDDMIIGKKRDPITFQFVQDGSSLHDVDVFLLSSTYRMMFLRLLTLYAAEAQDGKKTKEIMNRMEELFPKNKIGYPYESQYAFMEYYKTIKNEKRAKEFSIQLIKQLSPIAQKATISKEKNNVVNIVFNCFLYNRQFGSAQKLLDGYLKRKHLTIEERVRVKVLQNELQRRK